MARTLTSVVSVLVFVPSNAPGAWFIRGDVNASGSPNVTDAVGILRHLFQGQELSCKRAADVNDDGNLDITDAVALLGYLFQSGREPAAPFPACGYDPRDDGLGCASFPLCGSRGVFFCLDRSGSMCTTTVIGRMKDIARKSIEQLSEGDQFVVIFFDVGFSRFPQTDPPADASSEEKAKGLEFIQRATCGSGGCPLNALLAALEYAGNSTVEHKTITYISDGYSGCPNSDQATYLAKVLVEVAAKNTAGVRIDTVGIGYSPNVNEVWLRELAAQNGGSYTPILLK